MKKLKVIFPLLLLFAISVFALTACPGSHTVTFNTGEGGSIVITQTIENGEFATEPAEPTRQGFVFSHWSREAGGQTPFNFETNPIRESKTLYAVWTTAPPPATYTFIFNASASDSGVSVVFSPATAVAEGSVVIITITIAGTHEKGDDFLVMLGNADITDYINWNNSYTVGIITTAMISGTASARTIIVNGINLIDTELLPGPSFPVANNNITATYGQTLADIAGELPAGWLWVESGATRVSPVGEIGNQTHQARFPATITHAESLFGVTVVVSQAAGPVDPTAPDDITATYGQTLADIENQLPNGWEWAATLTTRVSPAGEIGSHTHQARIAATTTHLASNAVDVTVAVSRATAPTFPQGYEITAVYGQTLADIENQLPNGWEWIENDTTPVGEVGDRTHQARLPQTATHLEATHGVVVAVSRAAGPVDPIFPAGYDNIPATYGQTLADLADQLPVGWEWVEAGATIVGSVGDRIHQVRIAQTATHLASNEVDITIAVSRAAAPTFPQGYEITATYGQTLADIENQLPNGWEWIENDNTPVGEVGDRTHQARLPQTATHLESTHGVVVAVSRAAGPVDPIFPSTYEIKATYGQTLADIADQLPNGWEWVQDGTTPVGAAGDRIHQAKIAQTATHLASNAVDVIVEVSRIAGQINPDFPQDYLLLAHYNQTLADIADQLPNGWEWVQDGTTPVGTIGITGDTTHQARIAQTTIQYASTPVDVTVLVLAPGLADPTFPQGYHIAATYGQVLSDIANLLPAGWEWAAAGTTLVGMVGTQNHQVRIAQTASQLASAPINITIEISKAIPVFPPALNITATYGQTLADIANRLPQGWVWTASENTPVGELGEQTHQARFDETATHLEAFYNVVILVEPPRFDVSFILNGGEGGPNTINNVYEILAIPAPNPSKLNFIFMGWYTDEYATDGNRATFPLKVTGNMTLYARWGIQLALAAPAVGNIIIDTIGEGTNPQATAFSIVWTVYGSNTPITHNTFAHSTRYVATITLVRLNDPLFGTAFNLPIRENAFIIPGAVSATNAAGSGVITATFPFTQIQLDNVPVPVYGAIPITAFENDMFDGIVEWTNMRGAAFGRGFGYQATITLTPKNGIDLDYIRANTFSMSGIQSITNLAGSLIVNITFGMLTRVIVPVCLNDYFVVEALYGYDFDSVLGGVPFRFTVLVAPTHAVTVRAPLTNAVMTPDAYGIFSFIIAAHIFFDNSLNITAELITFNVNLPINPFFTVIAEQGYTFNNIAPGDDLRFRVEVADTHENLVVRIGDGAPLIPDSEGVFSIYDIRANITNLSITVSLKPLDIDLDGVWKFISWTGMHTINPVRNEVGIDIDGTTGYLLFPDGLFDDDDEEYIYYLPVSIWIVDQLFIYIRLAFMPADSLAMRLEYCLVSGALFIRDTPGFWASYGFSVNNRLIREDAHPIPELIGMWEVRRQIFVDGLPAENSVVLDIREDGTMGITFNGVINDVNFDNVSYEVFNHRVVFYPRLGRTRLDFDVEPGSGNMVQLDIREDGTLVVVVGTGFRGFTTSVYNTFTRVPPPLPCINGVWVFNHQGFGGPGDIVRVTLTINETQGIFATPTAYLNVLIEFEGLYIIITGDGVTQGPITLRFEDGYLVDTDVFAFINIGGRMIFFGGEEIVIAFYELLPVPAIYIDGLWHFVWENWDQTIQEDVFIEIDGNTATLILENGDIELTVVVNDKFVVFTTVEFFDQGAGNIARETATFEYIDGVLVWINGDIAWMLWQAEFNRVVIENHLDGMWYFERFMTHIRPEPFVITLDISGGAAILHYHVFESRHLNLEITISGSLVEFYNTGNGETAVFEYVYGALIWVSGDIAYILEQAEFNRLED